MLFHAGSAWEHHGLWDIRRSASITLSFAYSEGGSGLYVGAVQDSSMAGSLSGMFPDSNYVFSRQQPGPASKSSRVVAPRASLSLASRRPRRYGQDYQPVLSADLTSIVARARWLDRLDV
jgi:hypothetical protein